MVKVRKKQSKRIALSKKYNIQKKCKNAERKNKRMVKKMKALGTIPNNRKKSPGLPNLFPYKAQLIDQMERKENEAVENKKKAQKLKQKLKKKMRTDEEEMKEDNDVEQYMEEITGKIIRLAKGFG